jgi:hypothetical protein
VIDMGVARHIWLIRATLGHFKVFVAETAHLTWECRHRRFLFPSSNLSSCCFSLNRVVSKPEPGWAGEPQGAMERAEGDLFGLLGYDCNLLRVEETF